MQKVLKLTVILFSFFLLGSSGPAKNGKVVWLTLDELKTAYAKKPRPVIIDVYTSWCGWCKVMDRETYSNEKVANYINENFYPVTLMPSPPTR